MKYKYLWLTPVVTAGHKVFVTGFYQNEIGHGALIPTIINTVFFSILIFIVPSIIAIVNYIKTKRFSWTLMNKMTLYALVLYLLLLVLPEIYTNSTTKSIERPTTGKKN